MDGALRLAVAAVVVCGAFPACAGSVLPTRTGALGLASQASVRAPAGAPATLTIALPPIQPAKTPISWATPGPNLLSPATKSVSGSIGGRKFGPIRLRSGVSNCQSADAGLPLRCTITVKAAVGQGERLILRTFAAPSVSTKPLATSSEIVDIFAGKNALKARLLGLAEHLFARTGVHIVQQGQWQLLPILVYATDASKSVIPNAQVRGANGKIIKDLQIQFTGFFDGTACSIVQCGSVSCCGYNSFFNYDGVETGREDLVTTATGYAATTSHIRALAGPSEPATLLVSNAYNASPSQSALTEFLLGSSGNVAPIRAIQPGGNVFGEDAGGDYWDGSTHYSNVGKVLGTLTPPRGFVLSAADASGHVYGVEASPPESGDICLLAEFPAHKYGSQKPIRQINCAQELNGGYAGTIAVDAGENIYLTINPAPYSSLQPTIYEYAANAGSGNVTPVRTITIDTGTSNIGAAIVGTDTNENLYVLGNNELLEFAPGSTTGRQILAGVSIAPKAVDGAGDIFGVNTAVPPAVEEFPVGSLTPSSIITGSETQLSNPGAILVPL
jgi:hypothetical protein